MKRGLVYNQDVLAGRIWQDEDGYHFQYVHSYLNELNTMPISLMLPKQEEKYSSNVMLPFFDGLIPEGWLLNLTAKHWKLDLNNRMDLLLTVCEDCIGSVSIKKVKNNDIW